MGDKITTLELYDEIKPEHVVAAIHSYRKDVKDWKKHSNANYFIYYENEIRADFLLFQFLKHFRLGFYDKSLFLQGIGYMSSAYSTLSF